MSILDAEGRLRLPWRVLIFGAGLLAIQIAAGIGAVVVLVIALAIQGEQFDLRPGGESQAGTAPDAADDVYLAETADHPPDKPGD